MHDDQTVLPAFVRMHLSPYDGRDWHVYDAHQLIPSCYIRCNGRPIECARAAAAKAALKA